MRAVVRVIDNLLRTSQGIYEFIDDPECILRLQLTHANHTVNIGNVRILKGEPMLAVHVWNKRMPKLPPEGTNLE